MFPSLGNDETAMILELQAACDLVPWLRGLDSKRLHDGSMTFRAADRSKL